jgi:hypothetical protein
MRRRIYGLMLALVGSLVLGAIAGESFFGLFIRAMPPAVLPSLNKSTDHMIFLGTGLLAGLVLFGWTLVVLGVSPLFRGRKKHAQVEESDQAPPAR